MSSLRADDSDLFLTYTAVATASAQKLPGTFAETASQLRHFSDLLGQMARILYLVNVSVLGIASDFTLADFIG